MGDGHLPAPLSVVTASQGRFGGDVPSDLAELTVGVLRFPHEVAKRLTLGQMVISHHDAHRPGDRPIAFQGGPELLDLARGSETGEGNPAISANVRSAC